MPGQPVTLPQKLLLVRNKLLKLASDSQKLILESPEKACILINGFRHLNEEILNFIAKIMKKLMNWLNFSIITGDPSMD